MYISEEKSSVLTRPLLINHRPLDITCAGYIALSRMLINLYHILPTLFSSISTPYNHIPYEYLPVGRCGEEMSVKIFFLIVCFIAIILTPIPLTWHIKLRNVPAVCLICWITIFNMISLVNALIWGGSEDEFETSWNGAVFCDIEIKFIIAASAGMMTATAAISRNLARVMEQVGPAHKTKAIRRSELIQDLLICFGPPIWLMSAHYIVQPNRYYIVRYVGCTPSVDNSWPTIPLIYIWPPIIGFVAAYYAGSNPILFLFSFSPPPRSSLSIS